MQLALESHAEQVGFVMVKPHAFDMCLDPVISEILHGDGLAHQLSTDDPLRPDSRILSRKDRNYSLPL